MNLLINKKSLYKSYIIKKLSIKEIAKLYNCCTCTIYNFLYTYNIKKSRTVLSKCINCNKILYNKRAKRCLSCNMKHSWKTNEKVRISRTGKNSNWYGNIPKRTGWVSYKNINMRSTWEKKYAQYLDKNKIKWKYESKCFKIIINGKHTTYTPDFYLPETMKYIEIKGYSRLDAIIKFNTFRQQYPQILICIFKEKELKQLGIKI